MSGFKKLPSFVLTERDKLSALDFKASTSVATSLTVLTQPTGAVTGAALGTAPVFRELDQFSAPFNGVGNVTLVLNVISGGGGAVLSGTNPRAFSGSSSDVAFAGLSINVAGVYTLTATDGYGHTATTAQFTITPPTPVATSLTVLTQPVGGFVGGVFPTQPAFRELDQFSAQFNGVGNVTLVLNVISGGGGAVLSGTNPRAFSGSSSDVGFSGLSINVVGTYTLTATDGYGHTATTAQFSTAAAPAAFLIVAGITVPIALDGAVERASTTTGPDDSRNGDGTLMVYVIIEKRLWQFTTKPITVAAELALRVACALKISVPCSGRALGDGATTFNCRVTFGDTPQVKIKGGHKRKVSFTLTQI